MAWRRRFQQARALSAAEWRDLARAVWELALANRTLAKGGSAQDILRAAPLHPATNNAALPARVAWAIPRAAAIVPWRSDCLRQASAARRWLSRSGIESEIKLGALRDPDGQLKAHAWLLCGGQVLTGGAIDDFQEFG